MSNRHEGIEAIKVQLTQINATALTLGKSFDNEYIPLNTLKVLTDKVKLKKGSITGQESFIKLQNGIVKELYIQSKSFCDEHKLNDRLPLPVLDMFINQIKINL